MDVRKNEQYKLLQIITGKANAIIFRALANDNLSDNEKIFEVNRQIFELRRESLKGLDDKARIEANRVFSNYMKDYKKNFKTIVQGDKQINLGNTSISSSVIESSSKMIDQITRSYRTEYVKQANRVNDLLSSGELSRKQVIKLLAKDYKGGTITYSDGKQYPIKSYYEMVIKNEQQDRAREVGRQVATVLDTEVYLYGSRTSSKDPRETCAFLEGKLVAIGWSGTILDGNGEEQDVYDLDDYGYGEPDGAQGINCGHDIFPFVAGVSII